MIFDLLKVSMALIVVIFLINYVLKALNTKINSPENIIKLVEKISVDNNVSLQVVKVCDKYYFMGVTSSGVEILEELEKTQIEEILEKKTIDRETDFNMKRITELLKRGSKIE